jgi:hypothetical protein
MMIGSNAWGAAQHGYSYGQMTIGENAYGAMQLGSVESSLAWATNSGKGSLQLFYFSSKKGALMTGNASLGLGGAIVTNDEAIVIGTDNVSHGDRTITADGFYVGDTPVLTVTNSEYTQAVAQAGAALPSTGGTLTGPLDGGGQIISNATLQILNPKVFANQMTPINIPNITWVTVVLTNVVNIVGGTWDNTYWTPGVVGLGNINAGFSWDAVGLVGNTQFRLLKNGVAWMYGPTLYLETANAQTPANFPFWNDNATNKFSLQIYRNSVEGHTNAQSISTFFYGEMKP